MTSHPRSDQVTDFIEQTAWCEGWRKTPLWLRALGVPKQHYRDGRKDRTYRCWWGELTFGWRGLAFDLGGYETAHLHVALPGFSAFIRLPFLDKAFCEGPNVIESPRYGFSTSDWSIHLHWARRVKIIDPLWQKWYGNREFLTHDGKWLTTDRLARSWSNEPDTVEPLTVEAPYHYLLANGEVQHVTATMTRERVWPTWIWFGTSGRRRKAPVSDILRRIQIRISEPKQWIDIKFSGEVGERAGSWKGGCVGCSYEMKPGETPQHTLRRMQSERRFR